MQNHKDDIGDLFSKTFENHQAIPEKYEWEMLNASLQDRNFFHFNAKQFNIYYASTIVFCLFVCLGVGSHYTYEKLFKKEFQQEVSLESGVEESDLANESETKTIESLKKTAVSAEAKSDKKVSKSMMNESELQSQKTENQLVKSVQIETNKIDSIPHKLPSLGEDPSKAQAQKFPSRGDDPSEAQIRGGKPKRTLYITKQDTIVKFDTLRAPKQKKKWFK